MISTKIMGLLAVAALALLVSSTAAADSSRKLLQANEVLVLPEDAFLCFGDEDCGFLTTNQEGLACSFETGYAYTCVRCGEYGTKCPEEPKATAPPDYPGVCGFPHEIAKQCDPDVCKTCQNAFQDYLCDEKIETGYYIKLYDPEDYGCRLVCREEWLEKEEEIYKLENKREDAPFCVEEDVKVPKVRQVEKEFDVTEYVDEIKEDYELVKQPVKVSVLEKKEVEELKWEEKEVDVVEYDEKKVVEEIVIDGVKREIERYVRTPRKVTKVLKVPVKVKKIIDVYVLKDEEVDVVKVIKKTVKTPKTVKKLFPVYEQYFEDEKVLTQATKKVPVKVQAKEVKKRSVGATNCCICAEEYYSQFTQPDY